MLKSDYEDFGPIVKIETNGMGVFEMPVYGKNGAKTKNTVRSKVAVKCSVGDRVVRKKGKARPFIVVPKEEWANLPATKEDALAKEAEENPTIAMLQKRIDALESERKNVPNNTGESEE